MIEAKTIASFEDTATFKDWTVVNDTVMGGVSRSYFEQTSEGNLRFTGELSLANNGGFVSIRNRPESLSLENADSLELRVRGDGRTYYLDLRSNRQRMAGSFRAAFATTQGEWKTVTLPLERFVAQSFGRPLRNVRLDPATIGSIGFTLSDKQPGPFQLEVAYAKSVARDPAEDRAPGAAATAASLRERQIDVIDRAIARGVPLFNDGNPEACAAIYEVASAALLATADLPPPAASSLRNALEQIKAVDDPVQKAWILRYGLDDARSALSRPKPMNLKRVDERG